MKPSPASSNDSRILVLGAAGFIGSHVATSMAQSGQAHVTMLRRQPHHSPGNLHATTVYGDITAPESLRAALPGIDVVVHSASYIGPDPEKTREVNEIGTMNVIDECQRAGIERIIYVSTAAVYGTGPHRGLSASEPEYHPSSGSSISRARAEQMVLSNGGEVVRPNLVFGRGDRWVIPGLLKMMAAGGEWPGDGSALLSIIGVADLGHLVGGLALTPPQRGQAFHAAYPEPIAVSRLLRAVATAFRTNEPTYSPHVVQARMSMELAGFSSHQIDMVTMDHWYRSDRLWDLAGLTPPGLAASLGGLSGSYPDLLPEVPPFRVARESGGGPS
ncbi:NAD(P)-dependent oxidoreductase [Arthrobacter sp. GMC3]|uniref:NAD-dependent epimerase/dehydratase family protein n=1 Tax=Arthrobacter sp. GMC3 TaxID=2058894 RepID=UPI0015E44A4C|nr:NAD-dependent epimerase/dehydratase family protein [Arthrobacter sp. GMC3]